MLTGYMEISVCTILIAWYPTSLCMIVSYCRRHKKRKQEEMQFIKGNKRHAGGYSSGGGLTSRAATIEGRLFTCTCHQFG